MENSSLFFSSGVKKHGFIFCGTFQKSSPQWWFYPSPSSFSVGVLAIVRLLAVSVLATTGGHAMAAENKTLQIALPEVEVNLDPHLMESGYAMMIALQTHRGLFRYTPAGEVIPDFVESWKKSDDGKEYVFKLREAKFSDGTKLHASHVVWSFARIFALESSMAPDLAYIEGSEKVKPGKLPSSVTGSFGVKVVSNNTVSFRLSRPSALFLKHLATVDCAIIPVDAIEPAGTARVNIGLGPYKPDSMKKEKLVIKKWRSDPLDSPSPPQVIEYLFSAESSLSLAKKGQNDSLDREVLDADTRKTLEAAGWRGSVTEVSFERFILLNPNKISLPIRKYLFSKVDQIKLASLFTQPGLRAAPGLVPGGIPGELPAMRLQKLRDEIVKEIPADLSGTIDLEYSTDAIYNETISTYLKQVWETPKLKINLQEMPPREVLKKFLSKQGYATVRQRGLDYFDGFSILSYFRSTSTNNNHFVSDLEIDKMLDKAVIIEESAARAVVYHDIQVAILRHYTVIPLLYGSMASGFWSGKLKSVPSHPGGIQTLPLETLTMK